MNRLLSAVHWLEERYFSRPRRSPCVDRLITNTIARFKPSLNRLNAQMMTVIPRNPRHHILTPKIVFVATSAFVVSSWAVILYLGVRSWNPADMQLRGTFGDSFGVLSALFAGLAFIGAATAAYFQKRQVEVQQQEIEQAAAAGRAAGVEARFFQLLSSLQTAVNETRHGTYVGRQATRKIADVLTRHQIKNRDRLQAGRNLPLEERREDIDRWFTRFYEGEFDSEGKELSFPAGDLLGHIFRLIYHIVRYLDESRDLSPSDKIFYIRILRAHLSNPELVLIFYNALSRHGYPKLHDLIERYDLLQNIDARSLPDADDMLLYNSLAWHPSYPAQA